MTATTWLTSGLTLAALTLACSGSEQPAPSSTGGAAGAGAASGGANASGGASSPQTGGTGGASSTSTGGTPNSGGSVGSGGLPMSGGAPSDAGAKSTGGAGNSAAGMTGSGGATGGSGGAKAAGGTSGAAAGNGGANSSGGAKATGGALSTGGAAGSSGATSMAGTSSGGAGSQPYKGVANSACADLGKLKASWWYNWTTSPGSCATGEFVPMISGKNEKTTSAVSSAITQIVNAGRKTVLGFNEPNKTDQSNLSVAQVLSLWPAMTANAGLRVGSPATSADAQAWFNDFMTQVAAQSLRVDFIAVHWYGWNAGSCDAKAASLESYLKWAEGIPGNRPIWITEWGCMNQSNPDTATVEAFFSGAIAMLAKHPRVERYAWYPWNTNNELVKSDGSLTPLGTLFANAPATK